MRNPNLFRFIHAQPQKCAIHSSEVAWPLSINHNRLRFLIRSSCRLIKFPFRWSYRLLSGRNRLRQVINYVKFRLSPKNKETVNYLPIRLGIFTKYECNLKCQMCLTHSPLIPDNPYKYKGAKEMDFEMFKDIIKRFRSALGCCFIGNGEPLLCKDLFKMIEYAHKYKLYTQLFTNGLILDKFIDKIIELPLNSINISINSYNVQDYCRLTGLDNTIFEKIIANVKNLITTKKKRFSRLDISATIIIDSYNYKKIPEMKDFCEELGFDSLGFLNILPGYISENSARQRCLLTSNKEVVEFFKHLKIFNKKIKLRLPVLLNDNPNNRLCRESFISMSIDGNGDVNGCEMQLLNSLGNGKYNEENVFNNAHFRSLRSSFLYSEISLPLPCRYCCRNS